MKLKFLLVGLMLSLFVKVSNAQYVGQSSTQNSGNISHMGNFGIGITNPLSRLHVQSGSSGLSLSNVSGLIVENNGSANDYFVFQAATSGGGRFFSLTNAGRVGIGTTNPWMKLSIAGDQPLSWYNPSGSPDKRKYYINVSSDYFTIAALNDTNSWVRNIIAFKHDGNVGIGIASLSERFQVHSTSAIQTTTLYTNSNTGTTSGVICGIEGGGNGILWHRGNNFIRFGTNATERMRITADGNVGIGTTAPEEKLHVNGALLLQRGAAMNWIKGSTVYDPRIYASSNLGSVYPFTTLGNLILQPRVSANGFDIVFATNNGSSVDARMVVKSNGNVGIGVTNPTYKLTVDGIIAAREIKVTTDAWADFVFNADYKLRTLYELEQFIKANNHLPEIPSEAEVKENGVSVGEMNAKLLQKVEELTLYVIELQKQVDELKQAQLNK